LPGALQLTGLDGQTIKASDLPNKGNWLLIYVIPRSHSCEAMLMSLKKDLHPGLSGNVVIVVGGTPSQTKNLQSKYADLAQVSWYADSSGDAFSQLKLKGVPVVIGVHQQTMQWILNGMIPDAKSFKSIVNNWLKETA
jgi:hypothetical protein